MHLNSVFQTQFVASMVMVYGYKYCFSLQEPQLPSYTNGIAIKLFFFQRLHILHTTENLKFSFLFSNFWVSPRPYWLLLCVQSAEAISSALRAHCGNEEFWFYLDATPLRHLVPMRRANLLKKKTRSFKKRSFATTLAPVAYFIIRKNKLIPSQQGKPL